MIVRRVFHVTIGCASLLVAHALRAENWPQWRGPRGDGISLETDVPTEWSREKNVAWRLPLPGPAGATPVVWKDRIFLSTVDGDQLDLLCVSTAGDLKWRRTVGHGNQDVRGDEGNSASPSPSTDGGHVWVMVGSGELACFDMDGNETWKLDLEDRYGKFNTMFGMTSTPVLDGDRLYLQLIHGDGDPATQEALIVALDKRTGREIWKHVRLSDGRMECEHSYASPVLYRDSAQAFLVSHGADYVMAHRLEDGAELWRCGGLNPKVRYDETLRFVASPVAVPGMIVAPSAKNGPVVGINPTTARGDITGVTAAVLWVRAVNTPDVPSPLVKDGLVYLCRENGNLLCLDASTGKEIYERRTVADRHRASPVYADGKVYITARQGTVTVVKAGRHFEILAKNEIGESVSASPVISNGTLYLRSFEALYAIRQAR
jgi:outer membrane protein assembly factor BamB